MNSIMSITYGSYKLGDNRNFEESRNSSLHNDPKGDLPIQGSTIIDLGLSGLQKTLIIV